LALSLLLLILFFRLAELFVIINVRGFPHVDFAEWIAKPCLFLNGCLQTGHLN